MMIHELVATDKKEYNNDINCFSNNNNNVSSN